MNNALQIPRTAHAPSEQPTFREVVAYLHGVADAVQTMDRGSRTAWPSSLDVAVSEIDGSADFEGRPSARLTLRFGEVAFELEGTLVRAQPRAAFPIDSLRGGSRMIDLDETPVARDTPFPRRRFTLPYWAPAVSLMPARRPASDHPSETGDSSHALAYSALALSLVPIAAPITSQWPETPDERISSIRLRCAPLSPELYALTGTDGIWET